MSNKVTVSSELLDVSSSIGTCCDCIHFKFEDIEGWGLCSKLQKSRPKTNGVTCCSDHCTCNSFVSEAIKTHHLAVLRKCKRCLGDNVGTKQDLDVRAISEAIDFVIDYANLY